jgi:hypothetical protein
MAKDSTGVRGIASDGLRISHMESNEGVAGQYNALE